MEIICMFCKKHIQYKEPLDDKRVIKNCCRKCQIEQDKILDEILEKGKKIDVYKKDHHE